MTMCTSGTPLPTWPSPCSRPLTAPSWSSGHNQLIAVSENKVIKVWNINTLKSYQSITSEVRHAPHDLISASAFDLKHSVLYIAGSCIVPG